MIFSSSSSTKSHSTMIVLGRKQQRKLLPLLLALIGLICLYNGMKWKTYQQADYRHQHSSQYRRSQTEIVTASPQPPDFLAQPAADNIEIPGGCTIPKPEKKSVEPIMVASYPGSGAKLSWKLIRAITGLMTGDDHDHNGLVSQKMVVSIKTHYPSYATELMFEPFRNTVHRSILLLRHPKNALPSFHNFEYEIALNLPNHSTRAPLHKWIEWRDERFEIELKSWIDHAKFWMEHHPYENRLVVSFERLISHETGPAELLRMGKFLSQQDGVDIVPLLKYDETNEKQLQETHSYGRQQEEDPQDIPEPIECIWEYIVKTRADEGTRRSSLRSGGPEDSNWPYTDEQLQLMEYELRQLRDLYPGQLGPFLDDYLSDLSSTQGQ